MKIKTVNITDQVVEYLKENIESGKWNIGEKIPSENQMVMELGVSRSSIRSALQYLIGIGVLKSYQGKGTFLINTQVENWDEAEYKITSDLGTGKTETTNQTYGETLNLPTEPTRRGYAFLGWFTQETGGTQVDGNTVFKEVASTTYYAHWEEATVFSVIVPAVLPVTVDQNGKVYVSNAEIVNHSTAAVQVSSVTLTAENGWTLVPYASDMSHAKVDSNQIGFKINSAQTSKTGSTEQFVLTSPWKIAEEDILTLTYDAVVSALSQPVTNANILCVLFVVEWA